MLLVGRQMQNRLPFVTDNSLFAVLFFKPHEHYHCFCRPVTKPFYYFQASIRPDTPSQRKGEHDACLNLTV